MGLETRIAFHFYSNHLSIHGDYLLKLARNLKILGGFWGSGHIAQNNFIYLSGGYIYFFVSIHAHLQ